MISVFARVAPVYHSRLVLDPQLRREERTLFQRGSMRMINSSVPLLIDHDPQQQVGQVHEVTEFRDADGLWHAATATVDDPPEWLKRGSACSIGFITLSQTQHHGCLRVLDAALKEVSLVSPTHRPLEPLARVLTLGIAHREPAEETIGTAGVTIRRNLGTLLAVR